MQIHCPDCERQLLVPESSVGRRARCPACQHRFTVPDPQDALEETVSAWIAADTEHMQKLRRRHASLNKDQQ
jgi:predicted Zn finger-like uncharacterized protein